jgi:hypothetical protein
MQSFEMDFDMELNKNSFKPNERTQGQFFQRLKEILTYEMTKMPPRG